MVIYRTDSACSRPAGPLDLVAFGSDFAYGSRSEQIDQYPTDGAEPRRARVSYRAVGRRSAHLVGFSPFRRRQNPLCPMHCTAREHRDRRAHSGRGLCDSAAAGRTDPRLRLGGRGVTARGSRGGRADPLGSRLFRRRAARCSGDGHDSGAGCELRGRAQHSWGASARWRLERVRLSAPGPDAAHVESGPLEMASPVPSPRVHPADP